MKAPEDLALTFVSPVDGLEQTYRLYLPSAYTAGQPVPLLVALHGTGGDQNKYFDHEAYGHGLYKEGAEKRGMAVLCPLGNDRLGRPTEWRGTGELNVLASIEDVCTRFSIDADRIILTGQSMGGTGTTYLCSRYPDIFAAGIPLSSTYGHISLMANLRHTPMFFVQGEEDWPCYAKNGPVPLSEEMQRLGYDGRLWMIPGVGHNTMDVSTDAVLDWAEKQIRVAHPRHITHRAYFPPYGRAWWVEIADIDRIGWYAEIDAQIMEGNRIGVELRNTGSVIIRPDPEILDLDRPIEIFTGKNTGFTGLCSSNQQIVLRRDFSEWHGTIEQRSLLSPTTAKGYPIGRVFDPPDWTGEIETTLGNWLADAMRDISNADIAMCNKEHHRYRGHYRAPPVSSGQTVHFMEMVDWLRRGNTALVTCRLSGTEILAIIEDNIRDDPEEHRFLMQVSGCSYAFDRSRPHGKRIVDTDIDRNREYIVVFREWDLTRTDTMYLAGHYDRIDYTRLEVNTLSAAWRYIEAHQRRISSMSEGRVVEV